jgi:ATP-binding protein involved in chromosome partitioning
MQVDEKAVRAALGAVVDPNTGKDLVSSKALRGIAQDGDRLRLVIELPYPAKSQQETLRAAVLAALAGLPGVGKVEVEVRSRIVAHMVQRNLARLPGVRNIVAVASGKGGVGKSTTAVNLALALAEEGARVGILDADIYGPSLPILLGLAGQAPEVGEDGRMQPLRAHGLQAMSIGFLVEAGTPTIWRGPMVVQALDQLLRQTDWDDLDYLVVDMPPGTGDVQLSLAQKVPVTGALIVTTPQDLALADAQKGMRMFEKVGVSILGVVENMSVYVCPHCGHAEHIFGAGGAARLCAECGTELLGSLPLDIGIRELADSGRPTLVGAPDSQAAASYRQIARKVAVKIAERAVDLRDRFPNIVVEKNG